MIVRQVSFLAIFSKKVEGSCGHHFHLHCIYKWLETKDECPLCREKWSVIFYFLIKKQEKVSQGNSQQNQQQNMQN